MINPKLTVSCLLLAGVLAVVVPGCDEGEGAGTGGGRAYPPIGSFVHVQFRRDFLGFAGDKGSSPVGTDPSVVLASSGELRRINEEFVVIVVANEPDRELWIPRSVILLMDVKLPAEKKE